MKSFLLTIFSSIIFSSFGQGHIGEFSSNTGFNQTIVGHKVTDSGTYLIYQVAYNYLGSNVYISQTDSLGNLNWTETVQITGAYMFDGVEISEAPDGSIIVSGRAQNGCDIGGDCTWLIQKVSNSGTTNWVRHWADCNSYEPEKFISGLSVSSDEIKINYQNEDVSSIVSLDFSGTIIDSIPIQQIDLGGLANLSSFEAIAHKEDSLMGYDSNGSIIDTKIFSSQIKDLISKNDTLFILTNDSLFLFDNNLSEINGTDVAGYSNFSNLKVDSDKIEFLSISNGSPTIITLNSSLGLINSLSIPQSFSENTFVDFSNNILSIGYDFELARRTSIRQQSFSRSNNQNTDFAHSDVGIIDIEIVEPTSCLPLSPGSSGYETKVYANALVKNFGPNTVNSFNVNSFISPFGICNPKYYFEKFENQNLSPGESVWLELGLILKKLDGYDDSINVDVCVYTSHPDDAVDTIVSNDRLCKTVFFGFANQQELEMSRINIYPNPTTDILNIESETKIESFEIQNLQGKTVASGKSTVNGINVSKLPGGIYLINIQLEGQQTQSLRFIRN